MVAVRPLVEALGGGVAWDDAHSQATVNFDGSQIAFWIGNTLVFQDGVALKAPVAPYLNRGRTMVPVWWLAVRLKAKVQFTGSTMMVETNDERSGGATGPGTRPDGSHLLMKANYMFPFAQGVRYEQYYDTWGDGRSYQGRQFHHEGTDILAKKGTPIMAVAAGTVVRYGWNTLGGYRVTIQLDDAPGYTFYYAHLDRYAPGVYLGAHVRAGQLLGYVGSTGEGPERTEGKFVTHLHFGIYGPGGAINPYPFLNYWEAHKPQL